MINGIHTILFTKEPEKLRAFFRDILGWKHVDAGQGWLIFQTPPAEMAMHPSSTGGTSEINLMCDDIEATFADLKAKGVECSPIFEEGWGRMGFIVLPDGEKFPIYQPKHPTAIDGGAKQQ